MRSAIVHTGVVYGDAELDMTGVPRWLPLCSPELCSAAAVVVLAVSALPVVLVGGAGD